MSAQQWDDALLDAMRQVGDPPADTVIAQIVNSHGITRVNGMMRSLVHNADIVPADMPASVRDYLAQTQQLPPWADMAAIERGEAFFDDNWPAIVLLLFCASLPSAYAAHKGAQVLYLTQRMTRHVDRRIFETAQFILDVMKPGGLSRTGDGIRSAQKVRLLHSAIRHIIEHDERWRSRWDPAWGTPINQEDLAGTLMTFSLQILRGMKKFKIPMTIDDEEAYLHAWKVVGHIMGVQDRLLPADMAQANELAERIFARQKGSSEAGTELTAALLAFMKERMRFRFLGNVPAAMIRQSIDADVADLLQVPQAASSILFAIEQRLFQLMGRADHERRSKVMQMISFSLVQELVKIERGGSRDLFCIPESLRAPI